MTEKMPNVPRKQTCVDIPNSTLTMSRTEPSLVPDDRMGWSAAGTLQSVVR